MPKIKTETYQEYRDRVIDPISPSFCGAKWYNATVWLGSGMTASCHHPPAHKIPLDELKKSYKALHNTEYKKLVREQMLRGERPEECDYCWKIEDLGKDKVSDRTYKSQIYTDMDLAHAAEIHGSTQDVDLKTLEIAFDSTCNFACSYCNPSFSTKWMSDIKVNGPYQNLVSDGGGAFQQDGTWAQPYGLKNTDNPYVEAFMEWWENDLQHSLTELRITGGEATMSPDFWRLMEWWSKHPECNVRLAVNSNLGTQPRLIQRLVEVSKSFKDFQLYTSNESWGPDAEYIRDGMVWQEWLDNFHTMIRDGNVAESHVMLTINALCLFSLPEFLSEMLTLKAQYGMKHGNMSFNILRFPSFQSAIVLPDEMKASRAQALKQWLDTNWHQEPQTAKGRGLLTQMEHDGIVRLISYLGEITEGHSNTSSLISRQRDFRSFYEQYDERRGKDFRKTFPELKGWFDGIPKTRMIPIKLVTEGMADWNHVKELKERAKEEGWVLDKQASNPGSQDFKK